MFKKQNGIYVQGMIPNVAIMKAPHVFQKISGEVKVAESSRIRDKFLGASPFFVVGSFVHTTRNNNS